MDTEQARKIAEKVLPKFKYSYYTDNKYKPIAEIMRQERQKGINCTDHKVEELKNRTKQIQRLKKESKQ